MTMKYATQESAAGGVKHVHLHWQCGTLGGCNPQESQDLAVIHAVGLLY
jgi:hypothetical protein